MNWLQCFGGKGKKELKQTTKGNVSHQAETQAQPVAFFADKQKEPSFMQKTQSFKSATEDTKKQASFLKGGTGEVATKYKYSDKLDRGNTIITDTSTTSSEGRSSAGFSFTGKVKKSLFSCMPCVPWAQRVEENNSKGYAVWAAQ